VFTPIHDDGLVGHTKLTMNNEDLKIFEVNPIITPGGDQCSVSFGELLARCIEEARTIADYTKDSKHHVCLTSKMYLTTRANSSKMAAFNFQDSAMMWLKIREKQDKVKDKIITLKIGLGLVEVDDLGYIPPTKEIARQLSGDTRVGVHLFDLPATMKDPASRATGRDLRAVQNRLPAQERSFVMKCYTNERSPLYHGMSAQHITAIIIYMKHQNYGARRKLLAMDYFPCNGDVNSWPQVDDFPSFSEGSRGRGVGFKPIGRELFPPDSHGNPPVIPPEELALTKEPSLGESFSKLVDLGATMLSKGVPNQQVGAAGSAVVPPVASMAGSAASVSVTIFRGKVGKYRVSDIVSGDTKMATLLHQMAEDEENDILDLTNKEDTGLKAKIHVKRFSVVETDTILTQSNILKMKVRNLASLTPPENAVTLHYYVKKVQSNGRKKTRRDCFAIRE